MHGARTGSRGEGKRSQQAFDAGYAGLGRGLFRRKGRKFRHHPLHCTVASVPRLRGDACDRRDIRTQGDFGMSKVVLTVDDSKTMRNMLMMALTDAGYTVVQAEDGVHGTEVLGNSTGVDVIITDINMPRMDGFGFIDHVRKQRADRSTPILVLTTESDEEKKQR